MVSELSSKFTMAESNKNNHHNTSPSLSKVKDDLGVKADDKATLAQRLRAQVIH